MLHVVDVLSGPEAARLTATGVLGTIEAMVTARLEELGALVVPASRRGVAVQVEVLLGRPFVEISSVSPSSSAELNSRLNSRIS